MLFKITFQENGLTKKSKIEVESLNQLLEYPNLLSYKQINKKTTNKKSTLDDYASFFEEFYMLLESKVSLVDTVYLLQKNEYSNGIHLIIDCFNKGLQNGSSIYDLLAKEDNIPAEVCFFIKNGENSGEFTKNIQALSQIFHYKKTMKEKFIKLLWYPSFLLLSLFISLIVMMMYILPQFEYIFSQFSNQLPYVTKKAIRFKVFYRRIYFYYISDFICFCVDCYIFI
jgi:type II secretory pathway component PulF